MMDLGQADGATEGVTEGSGANEPDPLAVQQQRLVAEQVDLDWVVEGEADHPVRQAGLLPLGFQ